MATATALGLIGPLALLAALSLNAALLWRAAPGLRRALAGIGPTIATVAALPGGESNVVALRPRLSPALGRPALAGHVAHPLAA